MSNIDHNKKINNKNKSLKLNKLNTNTIEGGDLEIKELIVIRSRVIYHLFQRLIEMIKSLKHQC